MRSNYERSLAAVLKEEGGYANHPLDPGGPTMKGITQAVYDGYRHMNGEKPFPVQFIKMEELQDIYKHQYWDPIHGDELPTGVDLVVFDWAVNSGVRRASKKLQSRVHANVIDGIIGLQTLHMVDMVPAGTLINDLSAARVGWLQALPTWKIFGKGWRARVERIRQTALAMRNQ